MKATIYAVLPGFGLILKAALWLVLVAVASADSGHAQSAQDNNKLSDFEQMLAGFPNCQFESIEFSHETGKSTHPYFAKNDLTARKRFSSLPPPPSYYSPIFPLNDTYHGLRVYEVELTPSQGKLSGTGKGPGSIIATFS